MEEQLIAAVFKRKAIWDPADELRKNSKILKTLWADVAKDVGLEVNAAKSKWKNLRAYFISQMRQLAKPKSGSSGEIKNTSSWTFYNQLLFLKDTISLSTDMREDSLSTEKPLNLDDSQIDEVYTETDIENTSTQLIELDTDSNILFNPEIAATAGCSKEESSKTHEIKKDDYHIKRDNLKKRKVSSQTDFHCGKKSRNEIIDIEKRKIELLEKELNAEDNSDLLFFKSLLPYMQDFTSLQKLRIRTKIQSLILEECQATQIMSQDVHFIYSPDMSIVSDSPQNSSPAP